MIEVKLLVSRVDRSTGKIVTNQKGDVISIPESEAAVLVSKNQAEYVAKPKKSTRKTTTKKAQPSK